MPDLRPRKICWSVDEMHTLAWHLDVLAEHVSWPEGYASKGDFLMLAILQNQYVARKAKGNSKGGDGG